MPASRRPARRTRRSNSAFRAACRCAQPHHAHRKACSLRPRSIRFHRQCPAREACVPAGHHQPLQIGWPHQVPRCRERSASTTSPAPSSAMGTTTGRRSNEKLLIARATADCRTVLQQQWPAAWRAELSCSRTPHAAIFSDSRGLEKPQDKGHHTCGHSRWVGTGFLTCHLITLKGHCTAYRWVDVKRYLTQIDTGSGGQVPLVACALPLGSPCCSRAPLSRPSCRGGRGLHFECTVGGVPSRRCLAVCCDPRARTPSTCCRPYPAAAVKTRLRAKNQRGHVVAASFE
eukprot:COSAG01_NODE_11431_length_1935_cov_1.753947_2_plen_288_part_00